jgi:hypothetical protein
MATLILSMDGLVLQEISLGTGRITIGRKPHNDIQIDNPVISGEHAAIMTILQDSFLEDLDSTNGTLVNGRQIQKHALRHNDVIEIGKYKLKYLDDPDDDESDKIPVEPPEAAPIAFDRPVQGGNRDEKRLRAVMRILSGGRAGYELPLSRQEITLGKPGVQVVKITRQPEGYFISHVEGAPPLINAQPLSASQSYLLGEKDVVEVLGVKMAFVLKQQDTGDGEKRLTLSSFGSV